MKIRRINRRGRTEFCLDFRMEGRRFRRFFASRLKAQAAEQELHEQERTAGRAWLSLDAAQRQELITVFDEVRRDGVSLRHVWDSYRRGAMSAPGIQERTLKAAVSELLQAKVVANRRGNYIVGLEGFLNRFMRGRESFPVHRVTTADCEEFIKTGQTPNSKATLLNRISTLFSFCVKRRYCVENPCDRIDRPTIDHQAPQILTPEQTKALLEFIRTDHPRGLAWFTLALLAGIRPQECDRLTWGSIDPDRGIVTLDAQASKVRQRRIVDLMPSAIAWLRVAREAGAELGMPHVTRRRMIRAARTKLGMDRWPADILRHTAASYLLAHHQDAGRVAMQLGNSPSVLLRHYRELVTKEQAAAFWSITPN